LRDKLIKLVKAHPQELEVDKFNKLICTICDKKPLNYTESHGSHTINVHLKSAGHQEKLKHHIRQPMISNAIDKSKTVENQQKIFSAELTAALIKANIPLYKVKNTHLKVNINN
jgi:hypothetical protein